MSEWSNRCDLCCNTRVSPGSWFAGQDIECPWCRSVRLKYGSYWQPKQELAPRLPEPKRLPTTEDELRRVIREELQAHRSN